MGNSMGKHTADNSPGTNRTYNPKHAGAGTSTNRTHEPRHGKK
jgi:hypothetical protein